MNNITLPIHFAETQRFSKWLWLLLISIAIIPFYGMVQQFVFHKPFGTSPMPNACLVILSIGMLGFLYFFWLIKLETTINEKGIQMKFVPFVKKEIPWSKVEGLEIVYYGFVGYGIMLGSAYGTVYNTKSTKGLWIRLKNGQQFVIGTQKETQLQALLEILSEHS